MTTEPSQQLRVGIIGVGLMGLGIASNIQRAGWPLNFFQHVGNQPIDSLLKNKATPYAQIDELTQDSDIIILCVTGSPQVEEIIFGDHGVLAGLRSGHVIIDCSTAIPSSTLKVAQAIETAGARYMDAPMTRTPKEAMTGRLNLIVGAEKNDFEAQLPLLQSFAENITYAGPVSSGHTLKLLHNFVSLGFSTVLAEAAACATRANIDPDIFIEVLSNGGGAGIILDRLKPYVLERDSSNFQFSIANANKDLGYYNAMAQDLQASRQTAAAIQGVLKSATESGYSSTPMPELITVLNTLDNRD